MIFFGLVYFAQVIGQAGGLINQPLMNYLKAQGLTSDQVAQLFAVLTIPWIIKPLYGLPGRVFKVRAHTACPVVFFSWNALHRHLEWADAFELLDEHLGRFVVHPPE